MALIEKLTVKDTFTNWRDKINALVDVAILAPMADEDGIMKIDVFNCNAKEVQIGVPVRMLSDVDVRQIDNTGSYTSSIKTETVGGTVESALRLTAEEDYLPWVSGRTAHGEMTMWTSMFDDQLHFSYINLEGEVVESLTWDPETNAMSTKIALADEAQSAWIADRLKVSNLSSSTLPKSYPVIFGTVEGNAVSESWDESITYNPKTKTLTVPNIASTLNGNAKTANSAGKWTAKRKVTLSSDAEGYAEFDGSADFTLPCSLVPSGVTAGQYGPSGNVTVPRTSRIFSVPAFRVDEKGRITEAFTRTVTFPYPEMDVDSTLSATSINPIQNRAVAAKFNDIDAQLASAATNAVATAAQNGLMSAADKTKLNSLQQWPRIKAVTATTKDASGGVVTTSTKNASTSVPTTLEISASNGLAAEADLAASAAEAKLTVNLSFNSADLAGDGLAVIDGKLSAPVYSGSTSTKEGVSGLVPSAPAGAGSASLFLNGAGQWTEPAGTVYYDATTSHSGLMAAADKEKLDGIAAAATKVSVETLLSSGTKVATITVNGTAADIYSERNTDTTYAPFRAATSQAAGGAGLVPAPAKNAQGKYLRGDATWQAVYDASQIDAKLSAKADLDSPILTGMPTAPTAAAGTSSRQIATTAFVTSAVSGVVGEDCPMGMNTLREISASLGDRTNFKGYVDTAVSAKLDAASPDYVKSLSISGTDITVTRGDGTTAVLATQDTNTTYANFKASGTGAAAGLVPSPGTAAGSSRYLCENGRWAVPPNTDTKVTNTLSTATKAYVTGTASSTTNTGTQVFDTGVFLTAEAGTLQAAKFVGDLQGTAETAAKLASARTINGVSFDGSANITVADSTKVSKTGDTMTGNLVVKKNAPYVYLQNTSMTKGVNPTSNQYSLVALTTNAGNTAANRIGMLQSSLNTAGNVTTGIHAYRNSQNATANASLTVTYESDGKTYASCPTPEAGDRSAKIATTEWVGRMFHYSASAPTGADGVDGDIWFQY